MGDVTQNLIGRREKFNESNFMHNIKLSAFGVVMKKVYYDLTSRLDLHIYLDIFFLGRSMLQITITQSKEHRRYYSTTNFIKYFLILSKFKHTEVKIGAYRLSYLSTRNFLSFL